MNLLAFIAALVGSLAWPVTAIVVLVLLREPLKALMPRISSLKYKEFQVDFENKLAKVADDLTQVPASADEEDTAEESASISAEAWTGRTRPDLTPYHLVMASWWDVEKELKELAETRGLRKGKNSSPLFVQRLLSSREVVPPPLSKMLDDLRNLRNLAAHYDEDRVITMDQAQRYADMARQAAGQLRSIRRSGGAQST